MVRTIIKSSLESYNTLVGKIGDAHEWESMGKVNDKGFRPHHCSLVTENVNHHLYKYEAKRFWVTMFVLTTFSDVIPISPQDFRKPSAQAIQENIHKKYANKIIQKVGLCICFWDLLKASDGQIIGGNADVHVNVTFRMIVFRPFKGEILQAVIIDQNSEGVRLGTHFFQDIWVPKSFLNHTEYTKSEEDDSLWIWKTEQGDYFYDMKEPVRFRVESEVWNDQSPGKPEKIETSDGFKTVVPLQVQVPYTIIGAMDSEGLGPLLWWDEDGSASNDEMETA